MLLVLTALSHFLILLVPMGCLPPVYSSVVAANTALSAAWYATEEQSAILGAFYHSLSALWATFDIVFAAKTGDVAIILQILYLTLAPFALHRIQQIYIRDQTQYIYYHSLWHLLSAGKGIAVVLLLQCPDQGGQEIGNMPNNTIVLSPLTCEGGA